VTYLSFIVRIWRERSLDHPASVITDWQGEIEQIQTGERWQFVSMEELLRFLSCQTDQEETPIVKSPKFSEEEQVEM